MKAQDLQVICSFTEDSPCINELIMSSFHVFLQRELKKVALHGSNDV